MERERAGIVGNWDIKRKIAGIGKAGFERQRWERRRKSLGPSLVMKRDFAPEPRRSHDKVDARCWTFYLRRGTFSDMNGQSVRGHLRNVK